MFLSWSYSIIQNVPQCFRGNVIFTAAIKNRQYKFFVIISVMHLKEHHIYIAEMCISLLLFKIEVWFCWTMYIFSIKHFSVGPSFLLCFFSFFEKIFFFIKIDIPTYILYTLSMTQCVRLSTAVLIFAYYFGCFFFLL